MTDPTGLLGLPPDPGDYQRRTPRGTSTRPRTSPLITGLLAAGMLAVGFVGMAGISAGREAAHDQAERKDELIALISARQERVDGLTDQLDGLRDQVNRVQENVDAPALQAVVDRAAARAGMTGVEGPGITVTFDDAADCEAGLQQDCRILDVDLQLAVNTLFAAGAEAVAVNDERVISTTAIRGAGLSVLVNYSVLSPPYEVSAIGDPELLAQRVNDSQLGQDFAFWSERYGLSFDVTASDDLLLRAFSGSLRLPNADSVTSGVSDL